MIGEDEIDGCGQGGFESLTPHSGSGLVKQFQRSSLATAKFSRFDGHDLLALKSTLF